MCNKNCQNCAAGCGQFQVDDGEMSVDQFEYILDQLKSNDKHLAGLYITGGEALLHPQISKILDLTIDYKKENPTCAILFMTNGIKTPSSDISEKLRNFIILNSHKYRERTSENEPVFWGKTPQHNSIFVAPIDVGIKGEFTHGCSLLQCGMGVNKWGFYLCGASPMMDFVIGADVGAKKIQDIDTFFEVQRKAFCKYCGFFKYWDALPLVAVESMSLLWQSFKTDFDKQKPKLTPLRGSKIFSLL